MASLLLALVAGPHFEMDVPKGWTVSVSTDTKLLLLAEGAVVQLVAAPKAPKDPEKYWKPLMERHVKDVVERKRADGKLDGWPCVVHDIRMKTGRVTWMVARKGAVAYCLYIHRAGDARDADIGKIRASIRLLAKPLPPPPKREELAFAHWRFSCVKPAGMTKAKAFDKSERDNGVVARFDVVDEQSRLMIRVYARRGKLDVKKQAALREKQFEERYERRKAPETDRKWKPARARKTLHVRLAALAGLKKVEDWYFADCRNGCSYEIQVYRSGPKTWDKPVAGFLKSFTPTPKPANARMTG